MRACLTVFLLLALPMLSSAAVISGTVKDTSAALVPQAQIQIQGGDLKQPIVLISDTEGHFTSSGLNPGTYTLRVSASGFEALTKTVDLAANSVSLDLILPLASTRQEITVTGKLSSFANSDPVYRQLRAIGLGTTFRLDNFAVHYDVATFLFKQGTITFLAPVAGVVTGAVFIGQGHITLKPVTSIDSQELLRRAKAEQLDEDFSEIVFRFSRGISRAFVQGDTPAATPPAAAAVLQQWEDRVRRRREIPVSFSESLLSGSAMDNVEAEVLAGIYNANHATLFNAYIQGAKHKNLWFLSKGRGGAIPGLDTPEEVALVNYDPESMDDGIWYLAHRAAEYKNGNASSLEERRYESTESFKIETVIGNNDHLTSVATVRFKTIVPGERVIKFELLPNLRVHRVAGADGKDMYFIQEGRKADGSFYAILPSPTEVGKEYAITIEYSGDKVISKAGNGSFYVRARTAWYPNLNGFGDRALYDLTYRVPKNYHVISVGSLQNEAIEDNYDVSHWITPNPIAVAGFNYGDYHKLALPDPITGYKIEGYFLPQTPEMLAHIPAVAALAPSAMTKYALEQTRAQLQLCTLYFGRSPFDHIAITEQPNFAFGQSWPNLVYLPISAYLDSTQRYMLFGEINNQFTAFVDEVTPHEVSHQWWGHAVGWASYHDQWLSEGFAEFSAGLFLQQAFEKDWQKDYIQFWDRLRKRILDKNRFGIAPTDAGPLWLGLRLISPQTEEAYRQDTYAKGAFVLSMIRSMMYNNRDRDKPFIDMMHDFVESHRDSPASTESFKAIVEKHMTKIMDLQHNGRLDWFFNEWVYGTQVPHYDFEYTLTPASDGKTKLQVNITQSRADKNFIMLVPVFADFGKGMARLGQMAVDGNKTATLEVEIPAKPKKVALNAYKEILER